MNVPIPPRRDVYVEHDLVRVHHGFDLTLKARALDPLDEATAVEVVLLHVADLCREHGVNPRRTLREAAK